MRTHPPSARRGPSPGWRYGAPLVLAAAVVAAYANSFGVPFVFDDISAITTNPTLRDGLFSMRWLHPPPDTTVAGRPVVNATLALNHALGGLAAPGYHVVNILIHLSTALLLAGIIGRTLRRLGAVTERASGGLSPNWIAWGTAAVWALHPLQTESVTYVVQRAESLSSCLCLLAVYCFVRWMDDSSGTISAVSGQGASPRAIWLQPTLSVLACAAAMGAKEIAVSLPVLVLLYDRTFVSGTFGAAWRARRRYYLCLAATWLLLAWLVIGTQGRGGSAGFNTDVTVAEYALTQFGAIVQYVRLAAWPMPLVFDYGFGVETRPIAVAVPALLVIALVGSTVHAVRAHPRLGFLGVWFLALLAPTSSVVPVATQTMAEHRVYLALAAVVLGAVLALVRTAGRGAIPILLVVCGALAVQTAARNQTYGNTLTLWSDTAAKRPENGRAHFGRATALTELGRVEEAVAAYRESIRLDPLSVEAHNNLGLLLLKAGQVPAARAAFSAALALDPDDAEANVQLAGVLAMSGEPSAALPHLERAARRAPNRADVHVNHGAVLLQLGRRDEARARLQQALALAPDNAEAHSNLGLIALEAENLDEAARHLAAVLRAAPNDVSAHNNLGYLRLRQGRTEEALSHYTAVTRLTPDDAGAHLNLGHAYVHAGRPSDALACYAQAVALAPEFAAAHESQARAYEQLGRAQDALRAYENAARLEPGNETVRSQLRRLRSRP